MEDHTGENPDPHDDEEDSMQQKLDVVNMVECGGKYIGGPCN